MKNQISRLTALGVLALALFATDNGWAYFSGSLSRIPNPEFGGWLGDATVGNWNGSAYESGWTFARYSGEQLRINWCSKGWVIASSDWGNCLDEGDGDYQYKVTEYYWDGTVYQKGRSRITGTPSGYASGDIL